MDIAMLDIKKSISLLLFTSIGLLVTASCSHRIKSDRGDCVEIKTSLHSESGDFLRKLPLVALKGDLTVKIIVEDLSKDVVGKEIVGMKNYKKTSYDATYQCDKNLKQCQVKVVFEKDGLLAEKKYYISLGNNKKGYLKIKAKGNQRRKKVRKEWKISSQTN